MKLPGDGELGGPLPRGTKGDKGGGMVQMSPPNPMLKFNAHHEVFRGGTWKS